MRSATRGKYAAKFALLLLAIAVLAASCMQPGERADVHLTSAETPEPPAARVSDTTFGEFSHKIPEHQQFDCISCHRREGKSRELEYAGHESCVGCHLNQFIAPGVTDANRSMCSICHSSLDSQLPPMKDFPTRFKEGFNMKFDHAAHSRGEGRPAAGCATCHRPSGPGQTIPSGIGTHNTCFACHTADSEIGSCNVCHELAPYRRTLQSQYNFKALFRHGDHRGVSCDDCHTVVAGAPQGRQVRNIQILQHRAAPGTNCLACHNGRRAFSGNNPLAVATCSRCHQGAGFGVLPVDTVPEEE